MAMVSYHNLWVNDWRVIITIVGWIALIKGALLLIMPGYIRTFRGVLLVRYGKYLTVAILLFGAVLTYFGFSNSMDIRVKFLGGAKSVTGSKYLITVDDFNVLIDCGLFQGLKELRLRNWDELPLIRKKLIVCYSPMLTLIIRGTSLYSSKMVLMEKYTALNQHESSPRSC